MRSLIVFSLIFTVVLCGCTVPTDDCWTTTPMTNNPNVIHQRGDSAIPGLNM